MSGLSGSGKSTTAAQLAQQAGAIRLRSDAVRKHLAGLSIHQKGGDDIYTPAMTDKTYSRLINLGAQLAKQGYRVVLDAKFDRAAKRQEAVAVAQDNSLSLTFLHCTAPVDVLKARVQARSGDIADATVAILAKQSMEPFDEGDRIIEIDTTAPANVIKTQLDGVFASH
ncbi:MAG: AAA family ATPase [Cyanobacteria bacterium J06649_4]